MVTLSKQSKVKSHNDTEPFMCESDSYLVAVYMLSFLLRLQKEQTNENFQRSWYKYNCFGNYVCKCRDVSVKLLQNEEVLITINI